MCAFNGNIEDDADCLEPPAGFLLTRWPYNCKIVIDYYLYWRDQCKAAPNTFQQTNERLLR